MEEVFVTYHTCELPWLALVQVDLGDDVELDLEVMDY
jgi:hypothetical protein